MSLKSIVPSERSQVQNTTYYMILFCGILEYLQRQKIEQPLSRAAVVGKRLTGKNERYLGGNEMFYILIVMLVTQLHIFVKPHQMSHLKRINIIACKVYFNKNNTKDTRRQCLIYYKRRQKTRELHNDQNIKMILSNNLILEDKKTSNY